MSLKKQMVLSFYRNISVEIDFVSRENLIIVFRGRAKHDIIAESYLLITLRLIRISFLSQDDSYIFILYCYILWLKTYTT